MRISGWLAALVCWVCMAAGVAAQTPAIEAPQALDLARVEAFMSGAVTQAMRDDRIVGVTVSVIDRGGLVMARGYGRAGEERAVDADTLFRIGSISKTFTWVALMQLVEAGELTLDDPVNDHLPEALHVPDDGFEAPVLVRHLMSHSAGFEDSAVGHLFTATPERVLSLSAYLERYRVRRVRPPGVLSVYSNYGAALAGAIVEHESGMDFASYVEARVLRPLGMAHSTFREPYAPEIASANALPAPLAEAVAQRISEGFRFDAGTMRAASFEYIHQVGPAGAMSASANEMALYMQALLDPARMAQAGVLSEANARALSTPIFANDERLGAWRHGFMSFDLGGGRWAYGHGGDTLYQHSEMVVSPDLGFALFVSINTSVASRAPASLVEAFTHAFFPAPALERAEVSAADSASFAGSYLSYRRPYHRTEAALHRLIGETNVAAADNGDLIIGLGGGLPRRFAPIGDGIYQNVEGVERVAFRTVDGATQMLDPWGLMPFERVTFLRSASWLSLVFALGGLVAAWGVAAGLRRVFTGKASVAALLFDGLCLLWLAAMGALLLGVLPWLGSDQAAAVYNYPGDVFPIACWLFAVAAVATPLVLLVAAALVRPRDWGWLRWARAGACVAVFGALALTLWDFGLLGYSGF